MKNRDNFIELMEEIDPRHLDEHIKNNTDTRAKRIKRYIVAAAIYIAACVTVFVLIPYIINHTFVDVPPHTIPGAEPITTDAVTESTTVITEETESLSEENNTLSFNEFLEKYKNLPVFVGNRIEPVFYDVAETYKTDGEAPEKYILLFEDSCGMAFIVETWIDPEYDKLMNRLVTIYVHGYEHECQINMFDGTDLNFEYTDDVMCVVRPGASVPCEAVIVCEYGIWELSASDKYFISFECSGNTILYRLDNRKTYADMNQLVYWTTDKNSDDVYRMTGKVCVTEDGIVLEQETSMTLAEYYLTIEMKRFREESGCETFEEYKTKMDREAIVNSDAGLMYRLLDMTVEEIETEFGKMTFKSIIAGGTPCYELTGYGIQLLFDTYPDFLNEPLPRDISPVCAETNGYEFTVYHGIYVGMPSNKLIDKYGINGISFSMADFFSGFSSSYQLDGYRITVIWMIPEELSLEIEKAILWSEEIDEEIAKAELIEDMKSGDANVTVGRITIGKAD